MRPSVPRVTKSAVLEALLIVHRGLRCRFARFKLVAHFLKARSESFNLLLLFGYDRSLFLHFAMFLEKLIEQHRVHCFVAHAVNLSVSIANYEDTSACRCQRNTSRYALRCV